MSRREANAFTGGVLVLVGSVALCAVVPGLEHTLNVIVSWIAGAVLAVYIFLVVRDLVP